jgi:hypothetical protein
MLASGHINRLGNGSDSALCLKHGLIVEADRPLRNGAVRGCIYLDMAWILTW